jgi:hypothetical protein
LGEMRWMHIRIRISSWEVISFVPPVSSLKGGAGPFPLLPEAHPLLADLEKPHRPVRLAPFPYRKHRQETRSSQSQHENEPPDDSDVFHIACPPRTLPRPVRLAPEPEAKT